MNTVMKDLEQLRGEVERLVYSSEESGFTICRLVVPGRGDLVTVAGTMPGIQPGERLQLRGRWINHPVHGYQFRADSYSSQLPASANAVRRYLASSLVKGIGPVLAGRLVDCFGDETLRVIDEQPERLTEAPGVGPRRLESIKRAWEEQQEIRGVMLFLQGHGVSAAYSTRIYKTYGQDAVKVVQENPYRLAQDVRGIGFITADKIARQMGIDEHSPHRAQAALEHLLLERAGEGHVFTPKAELVQMCQSRYDLPEELLTAAVGSLRKAGRIVLDGEAVFLRGLYLAERAVADCIRALVASPWAAARVRCSGRRGLGQPPDGSGTDRGTEAGGPRGRDAEGLRSDGRAWDRQDNYTARGDIDPRGSWPAGGPGGSHREGGQASGRGRRPGGPDAAPSAGVQARGGPVRTGRRAAPGNRSRGGRRDLNAGHRAVPSPAAGRATPRHATPRYCSSEMRTNCPPSGPASSLEIFLSPELYLSFVLSGFSVKGTGAASSRRPTGSTRAACPLLAPTAPRGTSTSSRPEIRRRRPMPSSASARNGYRRGSDCTP